MPGFLFSSCLKSGSAPLTIPGLVQASKSVMLGNKASNEMYCVLTCKRRQLVFICKSAFLFSEQSTRRGSSPGDPKALRPIQLPRRSRTLPGSSGANHRPRQRHCWCSASSVVLLRIRLNPAISRSRSGPSSRSCARNTSNISNPNYIPETSTYVLVTHL